jgi:hypothetical protein
MRGFEQLRQDVLSGARMLAKTPGLPPSRWLSLALGIGANTAIFSLIDTVLLKLLPVKDPQQLVALTNPTSRGVGIGHLHRETQQSFHSRIRSSTWTDPVFLGDGGGAAHFTKHNVSVDGRPPEEVKTRLVSREYFSVLGASAFNRAHPHGRGPARPGSAPYAVISYQYWQGRFRGSPSVLESRIQIAKADLGVIGVAQPHFLGEKRGA